MAKKWLGREVNSFSTSCRAAFEPLVLSILVGLLRPFSFIFRIAIYLLLRDDTPIFTVRK